MPRINIDGVIDSYRISDIDDAGDPQYYGFLDKYGNWYILQMTDTTARYTKGDTYSDYATNWANRVSLSYDYFHVVF